MGCIISMEQVCPVYGGVPQLQTSMNTPDSTNWCVSILIKWNIWLLYNTHTECKHRYKEKIKYVNKCSILLGPHISLLTVGVYICRSLLEN